MPKPKITANHVFLGFVITQATKNTTQFFCGDDGRLVYAFSEADDKIQEIIRGNGLESRFNFKANEVHGYCTTLKDAIINASQGLHLVRFNSGPNEADVIINERMISSEEYRNAIMQHLPGTSKMYDLISRTIMAHYNLGQEQMREEREARRIIISV